MDKTIYDDFDALMIALPNGDDAKVWKHFISIQTDLSFDKNTTPIEKECLKHLNDNLFTAISQRSALIIAPKLRHLRASLERRLPNATI